MNITGLDTALAGVRRWLDENLLVDTIRITLPATGKPVLNPADGTLTRPDGDTIYEGPGAVQSGMAQSEISTIPGALQPWTQETKSRYRLYTPLTAPIPPKDAVVTVIQVHNPANTALLGRAWICQDPSRAETVEVVRVTPMDQSQEPTR
ncbi:DUF6093 family protein [Streptomyces sp. NPDC101249]|uniref:DUF6093 family protein n=1 Tax=Streptomyces sp. NPDC101249 TaxID=3366140 RepID=UPI00381FEEB6